MDPALSSTLSRESIKSINGQAESHLFGLHEDLTNGGLHLPPKIQQILSHRSQQPDEQDEAERLLSRKALNEQNKHQVGALLPPIPSGMGNTSRRSPNHQRVKKKKKLPKQPNLAHSLPTDASADESITHSHSKEHFNEIRRHSDVPILDVSKIGRKLAKHLDEQFDSSGHIKIQKPSHPKESSNSIRLPRNYHPASAMHALVTYRPHAKVERLQQFVRNRYGGDHDPGKGYYVDEEKTTYSVEHHHRSKQGDLSLMDTTPTAHSMGALRLSQQRQEIANELSKSQLLSATYVDPEGAHSPRSRPRFLLEIEAFIDNAVEKLSEMPRVDYEKTRFAIFREAFGLLVEQFATYKSILLRLKTEYEFYIDSCEHKILLFKPTEVKLETMTQQYRQEWDSWTSRVEEEIEQYRIQHEAKEVELRDCKLQLQAALEQNADLILQLDFAKENIRDAFDRRQDLFDKLRRQEEAAFQKDIEIEELKRADKKQRAQLDTVQNDLHQALVENSKLRDQMSNMVHVSQFEDANTEIKKLKGHVDTLQKSLFSMTNDYQSLSQAHKVITDTVASLREERKLLLSERADPDKRHLSATGDGSSRIQSADDPSDESVFDLSMVARLFGMANIQDMSVDGIMRMMANEITKLRTECEDLSNLLPKQNISYAEGADNSRFTDHFIGLGTGEDVPPYLRYSGKVKNRMMSKRDTEYMVRDVWNQYLRKIGTSKDTRRESISEFLFAYLKKKYENQDLIADWGYNFINGLEKYYYDSDIKLFHRILTGQLLEEVYIDDQDLLSDIEKNLGKALDSQTDNLVKATVTKEQLWHTLKDMFPTKTRKQMDMLRDAVNFDQPGSIVDYHKLFEEDSEYNQSAFVETVRHQIMEEREKYLNEIDEFIKLNGSTRASALSIKAIEAKEVFKKIDPAKPDVEVSRLLGKVFHPNPRTGKIDNNAEVTLELFMANLRRTSIRRSGARPLPPA